MISQRHLEKSELALTVRDQHVFGLPVVTQHHLVILPSEAGFFISAKRSVGWICMIAVHPNTTSLYGPRYLV